MLHPNEDFDHKSLPVSKLRWYSRAVAANNKPINSNLLEVIPYEDMSEFDGQATDNYDEVTTVAKDVEGRVKSVTSKVTSTITAAWLPINNGNRLTPPNIQRGERLMIYQLGDSSRYFWTTLYQDNHLRRLETVIYGFSATADHNATLSADNMYLFEISTHTGVVGLYTSKANSEAFAYTLQLNTKEGYFTIKDDVGNFIHLNSAEQRIEFGNASKSLFDMIGKSASLTTLDSISLKTGAYDLDCKSYNVTCAGGSTHKSGSFTIDSTLVVTKLLTASGGLGVTQGQPCSLPGGTSVGGSMSVGGEIQCTVSRATGNMYASTFIRS